MSRKPSRKMALSKEGEGKVLVAEMTTGAMVVCIYQFFKFFTLSLFMLSML